MALKEDVIQQIKMQCDAEKKKVEAHHKQLADKLKVKEDEIDKVVKELIDEGYLEETKIKHVCPVVNPKTREMWGAEAEYWG